MTGDCKDSGCGCSHKHGTVTPSAKADFGMIFQLQPLLSIDKKGNMSEYMSPADKAEFRSQKLTMPRFESHFLLIAELAQLAYQWWMALTDEARNAYLLGLERPDSKFIQACALVNGDWRLNEKNQIVLSHNCDARTCEVRAQLDTCMQVMRAAITTKVADGMLLNLNGIWLEVGPTDAPETVDELYHVAYNRAHERDVAARADALAAHMKVLPESLKDTFSAFTWLCRYADIISNCQFEVQSAEVVGAFLAAGYQATDLPVFDQFAPSHWAAELINRSMLHLQISQGTNSGEQLVHDLLRFYEVGSDQYRAAVTVLKRAGLVVMETEETEPATHVVETPATDVEQKELSASAQEAATAQS